MNYDEIRILIQKHLDTLQQRIADYEAMSAPVAPDEAIGRVSRMDAINNLSVTQSALREAINKRNQLRHVLTLVGTLDFGKCRKCKAEIPVQRILIQPQSTLCVRCAR